MHLYSRRLFLGRTMMAAGALTFCSGKYTTTPVMQTNETTYDVIIVGGSYAGLAAAMALGRALRKVLVIDGGEPCNRQTPYSHNFLTQDGRKPAEISLTARRQVERYDTVGFFNGRALSGTKTDEGFAIQTDTGELFRSRKLVFATGIRDLLPPVEGLAECWGISVLHCPYCHGYEVKDEPTGILGNGEYGFEFSRLIHNWTKQLSLFTNGPSLLSAEQAAHLAQQGIPVVEKKIEKLEQVNGQIRQIRFSDGAAASIKALYTRAPFEQHCRIPEQLGCVLTDEGYIQVDGFQRTTTAGVYACGDATNRLRTVANAVAAGTAAGMYLNKEWVEGNF